MSSPTLPIDLLLTTPTDDARPGDGLSHFWEAAAYMLRRKPRREFKQRIHNLLRQGRVVEAYIEAIVHDHDTLALLAREDAPNPDASATGPDWRSETGNRPRPAADHARVRSLATSIERIREIRRRDQDEG